MSPHRKRYTPTCCEENSLRGYVLATAVYSDTSDSTVYGESWTFKIVDAIGLAREIPADHCPLCQVYLRGVPHIEVDAWHGMEYAQELQSTICKAQTALNAVRKKEEE